MVARPGLSGRGLRQFAEPMEGQSRETIVATGAAYLGSLLCKSICPICSCCDFHWPPPLNTCCFPPLSTLLYRPSPSLPPSVLAIHCYLPGPPSMELTAPRALTSSSSLQRLIVFLHLKLIFHVLSSLPILLHFHSPDYIDRDSSSSLIAFVRLSIIFSFLSSFFLIHYKLRCELVC